MFCLIEQLRNQHSPLAALLLLLVFSPAWDFCRAAGEFEDGAEGVRTFLSKLTLGEADLVEIDAAVERLGSDRFADRYLASIYLARLPVLPRERMEKSSIGAPLDKRLRLAQVFKVNTSERTDGLIVRAMEAVMGQGMRGLYPEIVGALEGRKLESAWDACVGACETTALAADLKLVRRSLSSETVVVRAGAAAALIKLAGKGAQAEMETLTGDPDDRIKLIAAHYLRAQKNPTCLKAYAALLLADADFGVRWESLDALQQITGEDFEYYASADKAARVEPAQKWIEWVEANAAIADLNFAIDDPVEVVLFNGRDLEGWKEVKPFFRRLNGKPLGWGVEDGNLVCFGGTRGHLRTKVSYKDFKLRFEYRTPDGLGDSGLGLFLSGEDKVAPTCLEVQIVHGHVGDLYQNGGFEAIVGGGEQIKFRSARIADPVEDADGWNIMEVKVIAGTVEVRVNGVVVNRASGCPQDERMFTLRNENTRVDFRKLVLVPFD
jgi:hypothetical protein